MRTITIATAIALLAPAAAQATDARIITTDDGVRKLQVLAGDGQLNRVHVFQQLTGFVVQDDGAPMGFGEDCSDLGPHKVHCTAAGVAGIEVHLLDGDDVATVDATPPALLAGDSGDDDLTGGEADDSLLGGEGQDLLDGGAGYDLLTGGDGDDTFRWSAGGDRMGGGSGVDRASYVAAPAGVAVSLDNAANDGVRQGAASPEGDNVLDDVEVVVGSPFDDTIDTLDDAVEEISCGDGNDSLSADLTDTASGCETRTPGEPVPTPTAAPVPTVTPAPTTVPASTPAADTVAPRLTKVRRRGRTVRFRLSEPARVTVTSGRRTITRTLPAGRGRIRFKRRLPAALVRLTATDAAGNRTAVVRLVRKGGRSRQRPG